MRSKKSFSEGSMTGGPGLTDRLRVPLPPIMTALGMAICVEPSQQRANAAMCQGNARISGTVIEIDSVPVGRHRIATRKYNVLNISMTLVFRFGRKHPRIPSNQAFLWFFKIEES